MTEISKGEGRHDIPSPAPSTIALRRQPHVFQKFTLRYDEEDEHKCINTTEIYKGRTLQVALPCPDGLTQEYLEKIWPTVCRAHERGRDRMDNPRVELNEKSLAISRDMLKEEINRKEQSNGQS